jgi:imidazolonepropionase-like amidohydrolase
LINEAMARNIRRAHEAGVKVAGGSDAGTPYNYHENYAYEVELMHTLLGMTPQRALHAATAVASELLGIHRGVLAPGEPADLLLLDRSIEDDIRALRDVRTVVKAGSVV